MATTTPSSDTGKPANPPPVEDKKAITPEILEQAVRNQIKTTTDVEHLRKSSLFWLDMSNKYEQEADARAEELRKATEEIAALNAKRKSYLDIRASKFSQINPEWGNKYGLDAYEDIITSHEQQPMNIQSKSSKQQDNSTPSPVNTSSSKKVETGLKRSYTEEPVVWMEDGNYVAMNEYAQMKMSKFSKNSDLKSSKQNHFKVPPVDETNQEFLEDLKGPEQLKNEMLYDATAASREEIDLIELREQYKKSKQYK